MAEVQTVQVSICPACCCQRPEVIFPSGRLPAGAHDHIWSVAKRLVHSRQQFPGIGAVIVWKSDYLSIDVPQADIPGMRQVTHTGSDVLYWEPVTARAAYPGQTIVRVLVDDYDLKITERLCRERSKRS